MFLLSFLAFFLGIIKGSLKNYPHVRGRSVQASITASPHFLNLRSSPQYDMRHFFNQDLKKQQVFGAPLPRVYETAFREN